MAAYPSYNILLGSDMEEEEGVIDDLSPSGTMHSRIMYASRYYRWRLLHNLTLAQWQSLRSTYGAGKRDTYTFTYLAESPAVTYNVQFTGPPKIIQNIGLDRFLVEVPLRGVAA